MDHFETIEKQKFKFQKKMIKISETNSIFENLNKFYHKVIANLSNFQILI